MNLFRVVKDAVADEVDGIGRINSALRPADLFTMSNAIFGMLAAGFAARGETQIALILVLVGVLFDSADGIMARIFGGGPLGAYLDSLADLVTFGVVPATFLTVAPDSFPFWARAAVGSFYLACAMIRLARFEALRETTPGHFYSGMTSTGAAAILIAVMALNPSDFWILLIAIILSLWMVSRIRTLKLRWWMRILGVLTIAPAILAAFLPIPKDIWATCLLAGMSLYTFGGPFYILYKFGPTPAPETQDGQA